MKQQKTALAKILFIFNISAAGGWLNERDRTFNARHISIKSQDGTGISISQAATSSDILGDIR
ncbi:hypothetical protein WP5W18E06_22710 [Klebsiella quasipneumoniae]|nr:hypothetical protein WP5W18E06_22710 [Klebsiella quasipneumoniae]